MSKWKRRVLIALLAVLIIAAAIFAFSAQTGEESSALSGGLSEWLACRFVPGFADMTRKARRACVRQWSAVIRKCAHFGEFGLLGLALSVYFRLKNRRWTRREGLLAWGIATLYACTDEIHQIFVSERGPGVLDVLIDSAGALTAVLLFTLLLRWRQRQGGDGPRKIDRPRTR